MDHNVRRAITEGLKRRGVDVLTALEAGAHRLPDAVLLDRAGEIGRLLVTEDSDFMAEAAERQRRGADFVGVVYARQDLPVRLCVEDLELIAKVGEREDFAGRVTYLPLR